MTTITDGQIKLTPDAMKTIVGGTGPCIDPLGEPTEGDPDDGGCIDPMG
jgi:hypothetical protein